MLYKCQSSQSHLLKIQNFLRTRGLANPKGEIKTATACVKGPKGLNLAELGNVVNYKTLNMYKRAYPPIYNMYDDGKCQNANSGYLYR